MMLALAIRTEKEHAVTLMTGVGVVAKTSTKTSASVTVLIPASV